MSSWEFFWLLGGGGNSEESVSSTFLSQSIWGPVLVGSTQLTAPTWRGFQYLQNSSKIIFLCVPWGGSRTLPAKARYCSLAAPSLSLHVPLLFSISHCLNLPTGARESHGGWMKPIFNNQEIGDTERLSWPGAPQGPVWFHRHSSLICIRRLGARLVLSQSAFLSFPHHLSSSSL